eukprot:TRINITY_DN10454_c0_g1_i2.p2 TRINITY_DN10454_c0_g1~~TRINITY_DN10454_c0_g1_i2.p2  ORF type:complete len:115 (+),score=8.43 TRINITY_DN10454_c0_g1_i2:394-738(+)
MGMRGPGQWRTKMTMRPRDCTARLLPIRGDKSPIRHDIDMHLKATLLASRIGCISMHHTDSGYEHKTRTCLLYTSDAADEEDSVDLGGRRIIEKKKKENKQERGTRKRNITKGT